jgi:hypothetical protein
MGKYRTGGMKVQLTPHARGKLAAAAAEGGQTAAKVRAMLADFHSGRDASTAKSQIVTRDQLQKAVADAFERNGPLMARALAPPPAIATPGPADMRRVIDDELQRAFGGVAPDRGNRLPISDLTGPGADLSKMSAEELIPLGLRSNG